MKAISAALGIKPIEGLSLTKSYFAARKIFDVIGSIIMLSLAMPLMLIAVFLIKIDSPGPVLIKQVRVGINRRKEIKGSSVDQDKRRNNNLGSLFNIYKLRTMRADAESKSGPVWAKENDDRITKIGRVLRKTRLDEIPQFINVLKGDMGIIGPRPERPMFIKRLKKLIKGYHRRQEIKPGITGLAQVRYKYAASIEDTRNKLKYDLLYIRKMGPATDINILLSTFNTIVMTKGSR